VVQPEKPGPAPQPAAAAPRVMSAAATGPQRVPDLHPTDRAVKPSEDTAASPDLVDGARRGAMR
jgi:hypothetical protein